MKPSPRVCFKEFLEAGKKRLAGDTARQATSHEGKALRIETRDLQEELAEQVLENQILLENYYLPGDLEHQIGAFVDHYNNHRYHESIGNVTPSDAYFGRHTAIIERRAKIKKLTIQNRRLNHPRQAA